MAHRLKLAYPLENVDFIWNIDRKVGSQTSEPNDRDDVALVQILIGMCLRAGNGAKAVPGCKAPPPVNGNVDHATGFWIYYAQAETPGMTADGNLTPSGKSPTIAQLIFRLNAIAAKQNRAEWENLPALPQCPPSLKAKLLAPAR